MKKVCEICGQKIQGMPTTICYAGIDVVDKGKVRVICSDCKLKLDEKRNK